MTNGTVLGASLPRPGHRDSVICVAHDGCRATAVPGCPVPLCIKHMSRVFQFANDHIERARESVLKAGRPSGGRNKLITMGTVYFVSFDSRIKIGFATNLASRMEGVPHDEILAAAPGSMADEKRLHRRFDDTRITGEWFKRTPELLAYIATVRETGRLSFE